MKLCLGASVLAVGVSMSAHASRAPAAAPHELERDVLGGSFVTRGSAYWPSTSTMQGGSVDRHGAHLRTLQSFLAGRAPYVSVAMDGNVFGYGQRLRIRELETRYGMPIPFRVVDGGRALANKGRSRIEICVANMAASMDMTINRVLHVDVIQEAARRDQARPKARSRADLLHERAEA